MAQAIAELQARVRDLEERFDKRTVAALDFHCTQMKSNLVGSQSFPIVTLCAMVVVGVLRNIISVGMRWEPFLRPAVKENVQQLFGVGGELESWLRSRVLSWVAASQGSGSGGPRS